jgi:uncharacterized membrane protein
VGENSALALVFVGVGVLFIGLGVPLLRGRVPPNAWYGCRTHETLADEKVWYAVNRVAGRDMIEAGVAIVFASLAVLAYGRGLNANLAAVVLLSVTMLGVVRMAMRGVKS